MSNHTISAADNALRDKYTAASYAMLKALWSAHPAIMRELGAKRLDDAVRGVLV